MGSVYARGRVLWLCFKDPVTGKWVDRSTRAPGMPPLLVGQEQEAARLLALLEGVATQRDPPVASPETSASLTVQQWFDRWSPRRAGMPAYQDEQSKLKRHVLPELGPRPLADVRPRHLIALFAQLRQVLAPYTVRATYSHLRVMFRDAVIEELLPASPCVLTKTQLGPRQDKDPAWRAGAIYTRAELEQLVRDERIPADRRLTYALKGLGALRACEVRPLRWRQLDREREPLACLQLERTKGGKPRAVPVHPVLSSLLAEWRLSGWAAMFGRPPKPEDLILPRPIDVTKPRRAAAEQEDLIADLALLELRKRRGHDLRRTMISLARADGARRDVLQAVTHGPRGDVFDQYTEWPWATLCEAVACLRVTLRGKQAAVRVPVAAAAQAGGLPAGFPAILPAVVDESSDSEPLPAGVLDPEHQAGAVCQDGAQTARVGKSARGAGPSPGGHDRPRGVWADSGPDCRKDCRKLKGVIFEALAALEAGHPDKAATLLRAALADA